MTEKPLVFVSHASLDADLAIFLGKQIELVLDKDQVEVFVSSADDAIEAGSEWFDRVEQALQKTVALVVLLTPNSVDRKWVWFEIGYTWRKMGNERHIYPLAISNSQPIPHPLSVIQAKFLDSEGQTTNFFKILRDQFGFGSVENANIQDLMEMARNSPTHSNQDHFSDDEIKEILREYVKANVKSFTEKFNPEGTHIFTGSLIRYDALDKELEVPNGSSKAYLVEIAKEFGLVPKERTENTVRLEIKDGQKIWEVSLSLR